MTTLSATTHATERALTAIRLVHPDVRPAVMVIYRHEKGDRRGHYAPESWLVAGKDGAEDEIHISSTILGEGAESVLRTLLHEAAHSIAHSRGVQDVSRQNRYHNTRFKRLAEDMGLCVSEEPDPTYGYMTTGLKEQTKAKYRTVLAELQEALNIYQRPRAAGTTTGKTGNGTRMLKATCPSCGRIIRGSRQTFEAGAIVCEPCGEPFELEERDDAGDS